MNHATRAIYREVMDEIWINGGIPNDPQQIAPLVGWPLDAVIDAWPAIHDCLVATRQNPDLFTSERLEEERKKRNSIKAKRKKAADEKWRRVADAMQMHSKSSASAQQESAIQVTSNKKQVTSIDTRFAEFWLEYPRKIGKAAAERAWNRIRPSEELHLRIMAKVRESKVSPQWRKDNGQFIPHPSTWLNQGRWDDEIQKSPTLPSNYNPTGVVI